MVFQLTLLDKTQLFNNKKPCKELDEILKTSKKIKFKGFQIEK